MDLKSGSLVLDEEKKKWRRSPMDFSPYSNNNVVVVMRRMNHLQGMNLGKTVKKATAQSQ